MSNYDRLNTMVKYTSDRIKKWDFRFLELAKLVSTWSKDPSTKTGSVIIRPDMSVVSVGFNGFAKKMRDQKSFYEDRPTKYSRIIHCEINAILQAKQNLEGCVLYTYPFLTCDRCSVHVIQSGITRVVAPVCPEDKKERWAEAFERSKSYYREAGVQFVELEYE